MTRHELCVKLGVLDEVAAEVFTLTVFLCDDLHQLKPALASASSNPAATRFFAIMRRLPMELQMIVSHFAVGSMKRNILRQVVFIVIFILIIFGSEQEEKKRLKAAIPY